MSAQRVAVESNEDEVPEVRGYQLQTSVRLGPDDRFPEDKNAVVDCNV